jgi:hypothetical protein
MSFESLLLDDTKEMNNFDKQKEKFNSTVHEIMATLHENYYESNNINKTDYDKLHNELVTYRDNMHKLLDKKEKSLREINGLNTNFANSFNYFVAKQNQTHNVDNYNMQNKKSFTKKIVNASQPVTNKQQKRTVDNRSVQKTYDKDIQRFLDETDQLIEKHHKSMKQMSGGSKKTKKRKTRK